MSVSNLLGLLCLAGVLTGCAAPRRDITLFTTAQLREHLDRLTVSGFDKIIDKYATQYGLPATYLYAIASRETNCRNILGDSENGVGLFQIDARHHPIAREFRETGQWRSDPEPLIAYGVELLAKNMRHAEQELHAFPRHVHLWNACTEHSEADRQGQRHLHYGWQLRPGRAVSKSCFRRDSEHGDEGSSHELRQ
jgi:hypothetical protein